jgi:hypothetical protein
MVQQNGGERSNMDKIEEAARGFCTDAGCVWRQFSCSNLMIRIFGFCSSRRVLSSSSENFFTTRYPSQRLLTRCNS